MSEPIDAAIDQLESQHPDEVADAMERLRSAPAEAHDAVLAALTEHRSDQTNLARLLGEWGRPESVEALRDAVERGAHSLRYAAAMALAQHPDPSAQRALDELAGAIEEDVARVARTALEERRRLVARTGHEPDDR